MYLNVIRYKGQAIQRDCEAHKLLEAKKFEELDKHLAALDLAWRKLEGRPLTGEISLYHAHPKTAGERFLENAKVGKMPWGHDKQVILCNTLTKLFKESPPLARSAIHGTMRIMATDKYPEIPCVVLTGTVTIDGEVNMRIASGMKALYVIYHPLIGRADCGGSAPTESDAWLTPEQYIKIVERMLKDFDTYRR